ncbi:hypothetical protein E4K64_16510 [Bradyrhizobium frederickii]|uniref:Uncharacterized protein n=1 Tax=Bradyrhizobium frederickii TaxID=2560054 RepID=A0A4Y9P534_9BRAD|nr:hypothetical protein [Bradyrhizobium frederickii]TFV75304.1 hypothetical protein E4K64_16510 [Bradyrhizobium frederickii]
MFEYQIDVVDPKSNEERQVTVSVTPLERARAKRSSDWMRAIQDLARPLIPAGFLPIGNRVRLL